MKEMICPPLQTTFRKFGDTFTQIAYNPATEMYLYRREQPGGIVYYEVFCKQFQQKLGYDIYPRSSIFGFGCALCIRGVDYDKAEWYLNNGFEKGRYNERAETARIYNHVFDRCG